MWAGLLTPDEWYALQLPGRVLARQNAFWETLVDDVLEQCARVLLELRQHEPAQESALFVDTA